MAARRHRTKISKAVPRKIEGLTDLLSKLEVETERVVRRLVERAEHSSREIKKGIAHIVEQVRHEGFAAVASGKTDEFRRRVEDVVARVKDLQFLPQQFSSDEIIRDAKKNLTELVDRIQHNSFVALAKTKARSTKNQFLSMLSIPNNSEVTKLSRKITSLEGRVNKLTRKAA